MDAVPNRRLVIAVRADPVICGHSGEARNLAEAIRRHVEPLGGVELRLPRRQPVRRPPALNE